MEYNYLTSMASLPENVLTPIMKGSHVVRHKQGARNGIWRDMFIETTFIRFGHGKVGIIGNTLRPETLKTLRLVCMYVVRYLKIYQTCERMSPHLACKHFTKLKPTQESLLIKLTEND